MFVVTVEFRIKQGHESSFRAAVLQQAKNSLQREKDCKQFEVFRSPDDPCLVFLYEIYTDRAAFDAHCQTDHFKHFSMIAGPWIEEKQVAVWQPLETE
jgi:quinol monooxygenase YgiN